MHHGIINIVLKTLSYYRRALFYQFIIISLLAAVITGSLLTGFSVRQSLKKTAMERLGNTKIMISSGLRNFKPQLAEDLGRTLGTKSVAIVETDGFSSSFQGEGKSCGTKIFGIDSLFFPFLGYGNLVLKPGEIAINNTLAEKLKATEGEEIILNVNQPGDIPANSPFAPATIMTTRSVFRIGRIIDKSEGGDFSPEINQATPDNVFIGLNDLFAAGNGKILTNRILLNQKSDLTENEIAENLKRVLLPDDIGLRIRKIKKTGEIELISSRIFIDQDIIDQVISAIPGGHPLITYLVNSLEFKGRSTPYSFIAAIDTSGYKDISTGSKILISPWLKNDLNCAINDTLLLRWYVPGKIRELEEVAGNFVVSGIATNSGIWTDSLLMPEFPGIAGSKTCTDWDAGVQIKMDRIRAKDEDYWNNYRGTPKAFISYTMGRKLWGNNFGPGTAIRFPASFSEDDIRSGLKNRINPLKSGFVIKDLRAEMLKAADESVDFSTLFLSLGFFIIVSCILLLMLAVSTFFDSRKDQIFTLYAIGFKNIWISKMLLLETGIIAASGSAAGVFTGLALNCLIIWALNSVWIGAVQSGNLDAVTGPVPLVTGFGITLSVVIISLLIRIRRFLNKLRIADKNILKPASFSTNLILLVISAFTTVSLKFFSLAGSGDTTAYSFGAGGFLFISLVLLWRQIIIRKFSFRLNVRKNFNFISGSYYSFHSSRAVMPVILIAAGLFAVVITGINRLQINDRSTSLSGGTGGFTLWAETSSPVKEDLNNANGRKITGLDGNETEGIIFVQARRVKGNDASCLNLNYITSPPVLGIDPSLLIKKGSFSFASLVKAADKSNPWEIIKRGSKKNCIYGFADQTVLEWGLKKKTGDTLKFRSETGEQFNVIIAGGLKSSVFQGYLLIGEENFKDYFPSVSGSSVFLISCEVPRINAIQDILRTRFEPYGIEVQPAKERLASFFRVTNTYLSVFTTLGGLGLILGVIGLGIVLRQNYNLRKREYALMMASGFTERVIKENVLREQMFILFSGMFIGIVSSLVATWPSIKGGSQIPWISLLTIVAGILITGLFALSVSLRGIRNDRLVASLRRE